MASARELLEGKSLLKHVVTKVTRQDGKQYTEDASSNIVDVLESSSCGFCVDHSPDKVVGTAMENLLVSSQDVAFDKDLLHSLEVTHILNVGYNLENAFPQDFTYLKVNMLDSEEETLIDHYQKCASFIDQGRELGKVLIHCNAGCSRSVAMAICYVIHKNTSRSVQAVLEDLRCTRPAANPNKGFMTQLYAIEASTMSNPPL